MKERSKLRISVVLFLSLGMTFAGCGGGGGGGGGGTGDDSVSLFETTKVLEDSTTQYLLSISQDGSTYTFSQTTPELDSLSPGDVLLSGPTDLTPYGFLRKVVSVSPGEGSEVVVETTQATLEEAIEEGSIRLHKALSPDDVQTATPLVMGATTLQSVAPQRTHDFHIQLNDVILYDDDGDESGTRDDQIRATGYISFDIDIDFNLEIEKILRVTGVEFSITADEEAKLELTGEVEIDVIEEEIELYRYYFAVIPAGPIFLTPVLTVVVGVDGSVSIGMTTNVIQDARFTRGLAYDNGNWDMINDPTEVTLDGDVSSVSAECLVRGYGGLQLSLLVLGVTGPYAEVDGYLEFYADPLSTPWWELYGGIDAPIGVKFEIIWLQIADYNHVLEVYRELLAQAQETCTDADSDNYYAESGCGTAVDCDDNDATIYPGATEICGDGIDQDCDGTDLACGMINVALEENGGTATADSWATYLGYAGMPSNAIDGITDSGSIEVPGGWRGRNIPGWLEVELDQPYEIEEVSIWFGSHQQTYSISLSLDGTSWTEVVQPRLSENTEEFESEVPETFNIDPTLAKYIRVDITTTSAPGSHIFKSSINELQAYATPGP